MIRKPSLSSLDEIDLDYDDTVLSIGDITSILISSARIHFTGHNDYIVDGSRMLP